MEDVNISKFRAQVVRAGSTPASPGFVVSEGQNPVDPSGSGQNHLPVTIATAATGLSITESQVLGGAGTVGQYIRGDGSLADFPATTGGGSSVSYYLNGSVSQGTIGGVAYKELNRTPIFGAGTDLSVSSDGYIANFITDALDPNKLLIPGGNWNFETYFSASSSGGNPSFYIELYKYDGTTFTLLATSSSAPELIAFGTNINPYFSTLAVPQTTLALTDRLAVRFYVETSGRTITLHTEDNHLCQVITTFTTGLTALNGLTNQVQYLTVGTSGTDFAISSASDTHTFNLPTASGTNRGALSSADWTTFNNKQNALTLTTTGTSGAATLVGSTLNIPQYQAAGTYVTAVTASSPLASSGGTTPNITIQQASGSQSGFLSSTDWTTFNNKQNALTNPVTGTGTSGQIAYFNGTSAITGESALTWDATNDRLNIGAGTANSNLTVSGSDNSIIFSVLAGVNSRLHVGTVSSGTITYIRSQNNYSLNLGVNNTDYLSISTTGNSSFSGNIILTTGANRFVRIGSSTAYYYDLQTTGDDFQIIEAGTTPRLTIKYPNGNVLINTTTDAGYKLDVNGTGRFSGQLTSGSTTAGFINAKSFLIGTDGTETNYRYQFYLSSNDLKLYSRGYGDFLTINYSTGAATFSSTITSTLSSGIFLNNSSGGTNATQIRINNTSGDLRLGIESSTGQTIQLGTLAYAAVFGNQANNAVQFTTNGTARMTILGGGNVGIGVTNPQTKLHINGTLTFTEAGFDTVRLNQIVSAHSDGSSPNNNLRFLVSDGSGTTAERMRINGSGNVLIGTTTDNGARFRIFGNGVSANIYSNDNTYCLGLGYQNTLHGYFGGISSALYALSINGGQVFLNSSSVWAAVSDVKRKRNFEDYNLGLDSILGLKPKLYNMDFQKDGDQKQVGLVAQDVKDFIPLAYEENDKFIGLNYNAIIVTMVKAIQELNEKIK